MEREVRLTAVGAVAAAAVALTGCFVSSVCHSNDDCELNESCNLSAGVCFSECSRDEDCRTAGGLDMGKYCQRGRCQFRLDERVAAPNFCLDVVNPNSAEHGTKHCLADDKGEVVLVFFGLMA